MDNLVQGYILLGCLSFPGVKEDESVEGNAEGSRLLIRGKELLTRLRGVVIG